MSFESSLKKSYISSYTSFDFYEIKSIVLSNELCFDITKMTDDEIRDLPDDCNTLVERNNNFDKMELFDNKIKTYVNFCADDIKKIPKNLEVYFMFASKRINFYDIVFPDTIKCLHLHGRINSNINIPKNLEYLYVSQDLNIDFDNLPITLKHLLIDIDKFDKKLDFLPENLKTLKLKCNYKMKLENLPKSIENFIIGSHVTSKKK